MESRIMISGFGGQGIVLAGTLLGEACSNRDLNVTYMPEYGPETRGGFAACGVTIADTPIGSPVIDNPDICIAMDAKSVIKYENEVVPGGILVWNSSIIDDAPTRSDISIYSLPFNDIAQELGNPKALNMPILSVLMSLTNAYDLNDVKSALEKKFGAKKNGEAIIASNMAVVEKGLEMFKESK